MLLANDAATPPSSESIRRTAAEVVARPHFELDSAPDRTGDPAWFDILRWIFQPFEWLFESLEGLPDLLRWIIVIVAIVVCVLLIAHISYVLFKAIGGGPLRKVAVCNAIPRELPPEDLELEAERIGTRGNYIGAIRLLLRAALRRLEVAEQKKFRPGFTNRDLLRRYRSTHMFESLQRLVETIDLKWFGNQPCQSADYAECQAAYARIRDFAKQREPTHRS